MTPNRFTKPYALLACKMPKVKEKSVEKIEKTQVNEPSAINRSNTETISIHFHVKPGAKQNAITEVLETEIGIQISAPPVEGEANNELLKYVAAVLDVKKSRVVIERGHKSRDKIVNVTTAMDTHEVRQRLAAVMKEKI